jgi:hypothetical protein
MSFARADGPDQCCLIGCLLGDPCQQRAQHECNNRGDVPAKEAGKPPRMQNFHLDSIPASW